MCACAKSPGNTGNGNTSLATVTGVTVTALPARTVTTGLLIFLALWGGEASSLAWRPRRPPPRLFSWSFFPDFFPGLGACIGTGHSFCCRVSCLINWQPRPPVPPVPLIPLVPLVPSVPPVPNSDEFKISCTSGTFGTLILQLCHSPAHILGLTRDALPAAEAFTAVIARFFQSMIRSFKGPRTIARRFQP